MRLRTISAALFALQLAAPGALAQGPANPAAPADGPRDAAQLLERVVAVGASVTAGFGLDAELEVTAPLELFLDAALAAPHGTVRSLGNGFFFMDPLEVGAKMIAQAKELDPTLLVAVDFLFWYGYGTLPSDAARLERLDQGLELLAGFDCPMVVADFPDAHPALKGSSPLMGGGPIIGPDQIPSTAALRELNDRLRDWAANRPNVILLPLAGFLEHLRQGDPQRVAGEELGADALDRLLQKDLLHPTVEGTALIALFALDAARRAEGIPAGALAEGTKPVIEGVRERTEKERAKKREREKKREERRKAREEKEAKEGAGGGLCLREPAGAHG